MWRTQSTRTWRCFQRGLAGRDVLYVSRRPATAVPRQGASSMPPPAGYSVHRSRTPAAHSQLVSVTTGAGRRRSSRDRSGGRDARRSGWYVGRRAGRWRPGRNCGSWRGARRGGGRWLAPRWSASRWAKSLVPRWWAGPSVYGWCRLIRTWIGLVADTVAAVGLQANEESARIEQAKKQLG